MIYTAIDTFYLTPAQLEDSPSRKDDIDTETETTLRIYGAELVQEAGILLKLPQVVMATGQVLLHRFFCKQSFARYNVKRVAASCVWLATKLEESPRRIRDILFVFQRINQRREGLPLQPLEQFCQAYDEQRTELIRMERHLLKEMGFICHVEHPHKFIPIYLKQLGVHDFPVQQEAWSLANDSLRTTLCVRFKSEVVACGVIYAATRRARIPLPENPAWWLIFDAAKPQIDEICRVLADLYRRPKAVFVDVGKNQASVLASRAWEPPADRKMQAKGPTPPPPSEGAPVSTKAEEASLGPALDKVSDGSRREMTEQGPKAGASAEKENTPGGDEKLNAASVPKPVERASPLEGGEGVDEVLGVMEVRSNIANGRRKRVSEDEESEDDEQEAKEKDGVRRKRERPSVADEAAGEEADDVAQEVLKRRRRDADDEGQSSDTSVEENKEAGSLTASSEDGEKGPRKARKSAGDGFRKRAITRDGKDRGDGEEDGYDEGKRLRVENGHRRKLSKDGERLEGLEEDAVERERTRRRHRDDEGRAYDRRQAKERDWSYERERGSRDKVSEKDGRNGTYGTDKEMVSWRDGFRARDSRDGRPLRDVLEYSERDGGGTKRGASGGYERPRNGRPDPSRGGRKPAGSRLEGRVTYRGK